MPQRQNCTFFRIAIRIVITLELSLPQNSPYLIISPRIVFTLIFSSELSLPDNGPQHCLYLGIVLTLKLSSEQPLLQNCPRNFPYLRIDLSIVFTLELSSELSLPSRTQYWPLTYSSLTSYSGGGGGCGPTTKLPELTYAYLHSGVTNLQP